MPTLANAVVLVTGANGGLGTHFVSQALERGAAKVYAAARKPREWNDPRIVPLKLDVTDHDIGPEWSAGSGRPVEELAAVSVLVVDHEHTGLGIGSRLMDTCEAHVRDLGRHPVLEVVGGAHGRAVSLYLVRGWRVLGDVKPHWLPEGEGPVHIMDLPDLRAGS